MFILSFFLSKLVLMFKPAAIVTEQEFFHPLDPCVEYSLTNSHAHQLSQKQTVSRDSYLNLPLEPFGWIQNLVPDTQFSFLCHGTTKCTHQSLGGFHRQLCNCGTGALRKWSQGGCCPRFHGRSWTKVFKDVEWVKEIFGKLTRGTSLRYSGDLRT